MRPNTIQCGVGRCRSDTALLSILLLLSKKLYLTFPRSRLGWPITSLLLGSLQEYTSPKTELSCRLGKDTDTCMQEGTTEPWELPLMAPGGEAGGGTDTGGG